MKKMEEAVQGLWTPDLLKTNPHTRWRCPRALKGRSGISLVTPGLVREGTLEKNTINVMGLIQLCLYIAYTYSYYHFPVYSTNNI
jgi:hypothetical protein